MDWYTWLSKTGLEPSVVYEYGLAFAQNELEEEDIAYFNHEFLQSMGITIAKHRLEILKLARREKSHGLSIKHPMAKLLLALKKTKKSLANYIATLVHGNDGRALIVVPNQNKKNKKKKNNNNSKNGGAISYSTRWKKAMMLRSNSRKLVMFNSSFQDKLMLTNGDYLGGEVVVDGDNDHDYHHNHDHDSVVVSTPKLDSYSSPLMYDLQHNNEGKITDDDDDDQEDEYWTPALEEIRWDAMFQDLKPT